MSALKEALALQRSLPKDDDQLPRGQDPWFALHQ